jgi:hypothetical protein
LPLQFRLPERGPPFPFPIHFSSSSQKSSSISKFEKVFEAIKKNETYCRETLRRYCFKKPKREAGPSEQVDSISNSNSKKKKKMDDLQ